MLRSIYTLFSFCCIAMSSNAVAATGSIGSNQPCTLANGVTSCTVTVNYTYSGTPVGCVWLVDAAPTLVSCETVLPASFSWAFATLSGSRFELRAHSNYPTNNASGYSSGTLLAQHVAFARNPTAVIRPSDLSGDGKSDLIFRNNSTGEINAWLMNGATVTANLGLVGAGNWSVSHTADFNGDGKADILFRNDDGTVSLWLMNGLSVIGSATLIGPDANWRATHVGDFNGDGKADILWQNTNGAVSLWLMNGITVTSGVGLLGPNPDWKVTHVADFNGDGKADVLWRNSNGAVSMWLMNGVTTASALGILGPDPDWRVTHTADLNGDGKADLLWRNTNGAVTAWLMNGTSTISAAGILNDPNWSITHVGDFNGDGKSDILWRNTNGAVTAWLMNGLGNIGGVGLLGADANWRVTHIGDYNGDGKADLVWGNTNGSITLWLMNGATVLDRPGILGAGPWVVMPSIATGGRGANKYFGYFNNTLSLQDPYVAEVAGHTNLNSETLFGDYPDRPQALIDLMLRSKAYGLTSMPTVDSLLFLNPLSRSATISPNAQRDWNRFASLLQANGLLSNIAAFFIIDEPNGLGIGPTLVNSGISVIKANPLTANIPTAVNFAPNNAPGGIAWYPGLLNADWVGFDQYGVDDIFYRTCSIPEGTTEVICGSSYYDSFAGAANLSRQKVFLFPQGATGGSYYGSNPRDNIDKFVEAAQNRPEIIAILGFVWWSNLGGNDWQGVRDSPEKLQWITAGRRLTGKPQ
jgi:hypothetical protein